MKHDLRSTELGRAARDALQSRYYPPALLERIDQTSAAELRAEPWLALLQGRRLCRLHSRFGEAAPLIDQALAAFRVAGDRSGELWALAEWLVICYHTGEHAAGLAALPAALAQPLPAYLRAELHFGQFLCTIGLGDVRAAVRAGEAALATLADEADPWLQRIGRIQMLRNIAAGYHYLGQTRGSVAAAEQAVALADAHPDTADMRPWCYYELGLAYWRQGRLPRATETLDQARRLAESWRHRELWRWAVAAQGHVLRDQDRLDPALAAYQLANSWGEDPAGPAFIQLRQGRLVESRWSCETLVSLTKSEGRHGDALLLLGLVELKSNRPELALDLLASADALYELAGYRYHQAAIQLYRAAAGLALQRHDLVREGLSSFLRHAAAEQLITTEWWLPELIEPLLIFATQHAIEQAWAEKILSERFVSAPVLLSESMPNAEWTELDIARRMQLSLLPAQPPLMPDLDIAALVEPAAEIGGDFVGYFPRGAEPGAAARQIGIAVGDISGKGLGAALLLSGTVVALNTVATASAAPREVARALHDAMYPYTSRSRMTIAFCYSLLAQQPGGWSMRTVGAGAVAPLLRRAGGECVWLETAGFPLGTLAGEEWGELQLDLRPGDVVLLFSDGIIEAMDERREMFGFDRLTGVMCDLPRDADAHTIVSRVVAAVRAHTGAVESHDDMTLVAVRVLAGSV